MDLRLNLLGPEYRQLCFLRIGKMASCAALTGLFPEYILLVPRGRNDCTYAAKYLYPIPKVFFNP